MAEHLDDHEEELLQAALNNAFGPSSLPPLPVVEPSPPQAASAAATADLAPGTSTSEEASTSSSSNAAEDTWKAELETLQASWKKESAAQRAAAEAKRKQWEEIRAKEAEERKARGESEEDLWAEVGSSRASTIAPSVRAASGISPVPTDARDLIPGEGQGKRTKEELEAILPGATQSSSPESGKHDRDASELDSSKNEKWEEVSSDVTSSYPSLSYPSDPHSPSSAHHPQLRPHDHEHHHDPHHDPHHHEPVENVSPTFAIFDSRLSPKTRTLALLSSLTINLLLPFINGVMLGFGEIFARNVAVNWFGWKTPQRPASVASNVGLGRSREKRQ